MKNFIVALVFLSIPMAANAAIRPYYDSVEQITAVLASDKLAAEMGGSITLINSLGNLTYHVFTEMCDAKVELKANLPEGARVGKTTYEVKEVRDAHCE